MKEQLKKSNQQRQRNNSKQEQYLTKILKGQIRFKSEPFRDEDLNPDLVIKLKIPNQSYVSRNGYMSISSFLTAPSQILERVYAQIEKQIIKQMQVNKENTDPHNIKIRLQLALNIIDPITKHTKLINEHNEQQKMELECINQFNGILDTFTIQYNTFIYTLQYVCGFRVKAFVLYDKEIKNRAVFLFINLNTENLIRMANKYRIKKEVDYTFFDFHLNSPTTHDNRPLMFHSKFRSDKTSMSHKKQVERYFRVRQGEAKDEELVDEQELQDSELQKFRSCNQELQILFDFIKQKRSSKLSNNEKIYIFEHNRRKINPGVEKMFTRFQKRREYFAISKQILPKYGYRIWNEPVTFEEFSLPDKHSKGATFFNRFENVMLYKPLVVSRQGKLSLFLNMERSKLSYMMIKQHFKVSYLSKIGVDIFTLDNRFEKFGNEQEQTVKGGIDGQCLVDNWHYYSLFSDLKTLRNYMGQRVAYEAAYNNQIIGYMLSILIPYTILYTLEQVFGASIFTYTSLAQGLALSITYYIFIEHWQTQEGEFMKNYCDSIQSKVFLSKFRGPYKRNPITDEANQFEAEDGMTAYTKNLICFVLIVVLSVILGAIFYGVRMMIVEIYQPLSQLVLEGTISLPHILGYLLFFVIQQLFRFALAGKIIQFMVYLQNPPSDDSERQWEDTLTFFYLLSIELIPPFFLLILEPFQRTSCYSNSCDNQLSYYIYSRYLIMLAVVVCRLAYVLIFQYIRKNLKQLLASKEQPEVFYQDKLSGLLKRALQQAQKAEHKEDKMGNIILLLNYAIYCTMLPLSPAIMLLAIFIHFTSLRLQLLYEQRRPLNRSESIIPFSKQMGYIYYVSMIIASWINVFLFELVELELQNVILTISNNINQNGIFLLKLLVLVVYVLILWLPAKIIGTIVSSFGSNALNKRKDSKFKQYRTTRGGLKITLKKSQLMTPLKTLFRCFNPDKTNEEMVDDELRQMQIETDNDVDQLGSAADLQKKELS